LVQRRFPRPACQRRSVRGIQIRTCDTILGTHRAKTAEEILAAYCNRINDSGHWGATIWRVGAV
jgi:hypothetical protein